MTESGSETEKQDYVVTLEDKNSCHEVLKSKTKDDIKTNTSSVILWIKSLKEDNRAPSFDDPTSDHPLHSGFGNDSDDLQLGADAATLHEKRRPYKHLPPLWLDSDSDSSHPRLHSWTGRQSLLLSRQSYDRSLDSDTSGLSSVTSVSSLLTARESDPEDVLRGLGFRTPGVLNKIPDRFIKTGTVCYGVDSQQFLADLKEDSDGSPHSNSEVPPWIMARMGDIPRKFWSDAEERHDTLPILSKIQSPVIESTTPDELKSESPSRCTKTYPPSKFGNYLEPVTEEVEGGSTSGSLSPLKSLSLESRSTLKFNSLEYPGSDLSQVPSLFDLWQTKEEVNEASNDDGTRSGIISMNSGEHSPRTPTTSYVPENIENGHSEDWIDRSRNTTVPQRRSSANESTCDYLRSERENPAVPSLSEYTNTGPVANVAIVDSHIDKMESNVEVDREMNSEKRVKYPLSLRIPTLTISEPTENARKLSSVEPPDTTKLLPVHLEEKAGKVSETSFDKSFSGNGHRCSTLIQLNSSTCLSLANRKHFQIQFTCPAPKARRSRKFLSRNRKNRESKLSIMKPKHHGQLTLFDGESSQTISCFLDVKPQKNVVRSQDTGETVIEVFRNENETLTSLTGSYSENSVYYKERKDSSLKCETIKTSEKCEFEDDHKNNKYGLHDDNSECLRNDQTIEDRLDGLENTLRGVKMYKAGVHLMQLASSFETALHSRYDAKRSCDDLLSSIQQELKRLEDYMLRLQNELQGIQKKLKDSSGKKTNVEDRRGSDFSDITRQLLQEQLKIFSTISSAAATPSSTPSLSREPSICSDTPDVLRNTDVMKLRKEMQQLRQDSLGHNATLKDEILQEVRSEIRECFKEYFNEKSLRNSK